MIKANIEIRKFGGSQFRQHHSYDRVYWRTMSSNHSVPGKKILAVVSARDKTTSELEQIVKNNPKPASLEKILKKFSKYFQVQLKRDCDAQLSGEYKQKFRNKWNKLWVSWEAKIRAMASRGHICWRKGILTLGEMYNVILLELYFDQNGVDTTNALDENFFFTHILADVGMHDDRLKVFKRTYRNIHKWDFLTNDDSVAIVPGFAATMKDVNGNLALTHMGMEGSDLTALIYYKALFGHVENVDLIYHKPVWDSEAEIVANLGLDTQFLGKPLIGNQTSKFLKENVETGWEIKIQFENSFTPRLLVIPVSIPEKAT